MKFTVLPIIFSLTASSISPALAQNYDINGLQGTLTDGNRGNPILWVDKGFIPIARSAAILPPNESKMLPVCHLPVPQELATTATQAGRYDTSNQPESNGISHWTRQKDVNLASRPVTDFVKTYNWSRQHRHESTHLASAHLKTVMH